MRPPILRLINLNSESPMRGLTATVRCGLVVVVAVAAACEPIDSSGIASDVERDLARGRAYVASLAERTAVEPTVEDAIAGGYVERLRMGLGSPFRLIEQSLLDPRLPLERRELLAWGLLDRTLEGESYLLDPRVLSQGDGELAARHLGLIEGAVRGAADPDAGMLAVRLAYTMAEAEGSASTSLRRRVSQAASLVRDRVVSQQDAARLLRAAGSRTDPLALLTVWRVERRFHVERPAILSPSSAVERDAIALAPRLLQSVREARGPASREQPTRGGEARPRLALGLAGARLLAEEAAAFDAPPQTPIVVAVRSYQRLALGRESELGRFFDNGVNEERLAAEYALLAAGPDPGVVPRLAMLASAVGLRAYAQERPWFPGFGGPTARDLEDRYGLASVRFPDEVPAHWRPYYRRMLEVALVDLRRVLPSLDVRGLNVRFEPRAGSPGTLAVHDPRSRTVYIPAATGAGTIAHEVAHDIDWQTALRRYGVRGDYGTDRAVRLSDGRLAEMLNGLRTASLTDVVPVPSEHASRPAEVFARGVDWFVAVALAREGRLNGYLSSVQDDVLTGYGTVAPPDVTGAAGEALVGLLDEVAPVYPETRRWFLGSYGRVRAPTAYDLARRVVEAPLGDAAAPAEPDPVLTVLSDTAGVDTLSSIMREPRPARLGIALDQLEQLQKTRDSVLALVDGACRPVAYDNGATAARRRLVRLVADARARGVALEAAYALGGGQSRDWMTARLAGRTRDPAPDAAVLALLLPLAEAAESVGQARWTGWAMEGWSPAAECGPVLPAIG